VLQLQRPAQRAFAHTLRCLGGNRARCPAIGASQAQLYCLNELDAAGAAVLPGAAAVCFAGAVSLPWLPLLLAAAAGGGRADSWAFLSFTVLPLQGRPLSCDEEAAEGNVCRCHCCWAGLVALLPALRGSGGLEVGARTAVPPSTGVATRTSGATAAA
jgi:hypothetical protein